MLAILSLVMPLVTGKSLVAAAPTPQGTQPLDCVVPQIFFNSLDDEFSISVLTPPQIQSYDAQEPVEWSLFLEPSVPTEETISSPIISGRQLEAPKFRLVNQTLVTVEGDFPATLLSTITIFPPVLSGFSFGGPDVGADAVFGAVYDCEADGEVFLKLIETTPGKDVDQIPLHSAVSAYSLEVDNDGQLWAITHNESNEFPLTSANL